MLGRLGAVAQSDGPFLFLFISSVTVPSAAGFPPVTDYFMGSIIQSAQNHPSFNSYTDHCCIYRFQSVTFLQYFSICTDYFRDLKIQSVSFFHLEQTKSAIPAFSPHVWAKIRNFRQTKSAITVFSPFVFVFSLRSRQTKKPYSFFSLFSPNGCRTKRSHLLNPCVFSAPQPSQK